MAGAGAAEKSGKYYGQAMTAGDFYHLAGRPPALTARRSAGRTGGAWSAASRAQVGTLVGAAVDDDGNVVVVDGTRIRVIAANSGAFYGQQMTEGHVYVIAGIAAAR